MKFYVYLFFLNIGLCLSVSAQTIVQSSHVIGPIDSGYPPFGINDYNFFSSPDILLINIDQNDPNRITLFFVFSILDSGSDSDFYEVKSFKSWELNLSSHQTEFLYENDNAPELGELVSDATSVFINQNQFILERVEPIHVSSDYEFYNSHLDRAIESYNQQLIGGSVNNEFSDGDRYFINWHEIALWDQSSGNLIYTLQHHKSSDYFQKLFRHESNYDSVSIGFSSDDRFFYLRELYQINGERMQFEGQTVYDLHLTTGIQMINTETFEQFPADKDVAFTNDGRFYVTAVDGVPSLVSTTHGKARQQYNIEGKIMTAAAVSPDDQQIYIATHTDEIYVFPSQLPTSHVEEWEVYAKAE